MRALILFLGLVQIAFAQDVKTYIPPQAFQYLPKYKVEIEAFLPDFPYEEYFPGLTEHESCPHLKHPKCWNSKSRLKSAREEGAGLGQLTRTWDKQGNLRFDTLNDLKRTYKNQLKELSWENVYDRPDLQIRAIILLTGQNYKRFLTVKDPFERVAFTDGSYNAGYGRINKRRIACDLQKDCDPEKWFGHTENINLTGKEALYGTRTAADILNHHVKDVLKTRMPKYSEPMKHAK